MGVPYLSPSSAHWLGTNDIGQDILSELLYGARISLFIGITAAAIITLVGMMVGIVAGYLGGKTDWILMAICNVAMVLPSFPLAIVLAAYLGGGIKSLMISICLTAWSGTALVVRASVLQLRSAGFIRTLEAMGANSVRIMFWHIVPNISGLVLVKAALAVCSAMLAEAGLSFLGLGAETEKSWGAILHYAFFRNGVFNGYWWWYLPPVLCISLCITGFMLLGRSRRDSASEHEVRS